MENEGKIERDIREQRARATMEIEIKIEKTEDSCKDSSFRKKLLNKVGTKNYGIKEIKNRKFEMQCEASSRKNGLKFHLIS